MWGVWRSGKQGKITHFFRRTEKVIDMDDLLGGDFRAQKCRLRNWLLVSIIRQCLKNESTPTKLANQEWQ